MRQRLGFALGAVVGIAVAGCGGSSTTSSSTTSTTRANADLTFSSPGIAIHFRYPPGFSIGQANNVRRSAGNNRNITRAALGVGSGTSDLIIVTRYANTRVPVNASNIRAQKPGYDQVVSKVFGRTMTGTIGTAGSLPALFYSDVPTPGVAGATSRTVFAFSGTDEYELQCQWTALQASAVKSACDEMIRTLST